MAISFQHCDLIFGHLRSFVITLNNGTIYSNKSVRQNTISTLKLHTWSLVDLQKVCLFVKKFAFETMVSGHGHVTMVDRLMGRPKLMNCAICHMHVPVRRMLEN